MLEKNEFNNILILYIILKLPYIFEIFNTNKTIIVHGKLATINTILSFIMDTDVNFYTSNQDDNITVIIFIMFIMFIILIYKL